MQEIFIPNKDLIIGCYTNYSWDTIKYWVNSIDQCGFNGYKVMIVFNSDHDTVKRLIDHDFQIVAFKQDEKGFSYENPAIPVHVDRFFHIWNTLNSLSEESTPRYVITTDVKDVVFQRNPSDWLEDHLDPNHYHNPSDYKIVAGSECLKYKDESWGAQNLQQCFGGFFYNQYKDMPIYNVGVLGGHYEYMKALALNIFQMSLNRPIKIVDQAVFNFLIWQKPWNDIIKLAQLDDGWAAHLGTVMDPAKIEGFRPNLLEDEPFLSTELELKTPHTQEPFTCIHQYDRVPELKKIIEEKYNDKQADT